MRTARMCALVAAVMTPVVAQATYFSGASNDLSADWYVHSYTGGTHTTPGTPQALSTFTASGNTGLRLTSASNYQRTTLIAKQEFTSQQSFKFECEVYIGDSTNSGADGLTFFWIDKASLGTNAIGDLNGGVGEWMGAPHGNLNTNASGDATVGYYSGIKGYSFEFDHYQNNTNEFQEYNHFVRLGDWAHHPSTVTNVNSGSDPDFYYNNGWERVSFSYDAVNERFTYEYKFNGTAYTASQTYTIAQLNAASPGFYEKFDNAYFGIGAATGGANAVHGIREFTLIPEPSMLAILGAGALLLARRRR